MPNNNQCMKEKKLIIILEVGSIKKLEYVETAVREEAWILCVSKW